jgi:superfamily II DNA/RNA helicase
MIVDNFQYGVVLARHRAGCIGPDEWSVGGPEGPLCPPWESPVSSDFSRLGVPTAMLSVLTKQGITSAFPIQEMAIPPALDGRDVCGKAPTGSGKTIAFGVPIAQLVSKARPRRPRALVLVPTRELAAQVHEQLRPLLAPRQRTSACFYGGVGFGAQLEALRRGVDVAVACPGRLADLVRRGDVALDDVRLVVLDEADRMADMGFLPEVKRLLDMVHPERQTLLFSATLDGAVDVLVKRYQVDPVVCEVPVDESAGERTTHEFVETNREDKVGLAADIITKHGSTVVFCRTKHGADRVAKQLMKAGVSAVPIHGGRSQAQRDRALAAFHSGSAQALVATDVAARGIHVDDVGCVLHFDVAGDEKDYVHRSGRTGRAGAEGVVISFVTPDDTAKVRQLRRALAMEVGGQSTGQPARGGTRTVERPKRPAGSQARRRRR